MIFHTKNRRKGVFWVYDATKLSYLLSMLNNDAKSFFSDSSVGAFYHSLTISGSCWFTSCVLTHASPKTILQSSGYLPCSFGCKGGGECADFSPRFITPVESCAIHLCQPLYQPGPVCVYIKLIDEQFIRLMGSAGADKHPATRSGFKIQPEFAAAWHRLRQQCSMTPQPLW